MNNPESHIELINDAAKSARTTWLSIISVTAYVATILISIDHLDFMLQEAIRLPVIGTKVELDKFYFIAPAIILLFYAWCTLAHTILIERINGFENTPGFKSWARKKLSPYLVVQSVAGPDYGLPSKLVLFTARWIAIHGLPLTTLLYFQASYLPNHSVHMLWWHRALLILAILIFIFVEKSVSRNRQKLIPYVVKYSIASIYLIISLFVFSGYDEPVKPEIEGLISDKVDLAGGKPSSVFSRVMILPLYDLSAKAPPGTRLALQNRDFRGGQFQGTNFDFVNANGIDFSGADLRRTSFNAANIQGAKFIGTDLFGATMLGASAANSFFIGANLTYLEASGSDFNGARFELSNLQNILAENAKFTRATFGGADLRNAFLNNAEPYDFDTKNLQWIIGGDLSGVNLNAGNVSNNLVTDLKAAAKRFTPSVKLIIDSRLEGAREQKTVCQSCNDVWQAANLKTGANALDIIHEVRKLSCVENDPNSDILNYVIKHRLRPPGWTEQSDINRASEDRMMPSFDQFEFAKSIRENSPLCPASSVINTQSKSILEAITKSRSENPLMRHSWIDLSINNQRVAPVSAGGRFSAKKGMATPIYGARGKLCGEAPSFIEAMKSIVENGSFEFKSQWGKLVDGGKSNRYSNSCGKKVSTRVISYIPNNNFSGEIKLNFFSTDQVTVNVTD